MFFIRLLLILSLACTLFACSGDGNDKEKDNANSDSNATDAGGNNDGDDGQTANKTRLIDLSKDSFDVYGVLSTGRGNSASPITGSSTYYVVPEHEAVLRIVVSTNNDFLAPEFYVEKVTLYLFDDNTSSAQLTAWADNHHTDNLQDAPTPINEIHFNGNVTLTSQQLISAGATGDIYRVGFYFDNYADNNTTVVGFNDVVDVPLLALPNINLDPSDTEVSRVEVKDYGLSPSPYFESGGTWVFYSFEQEKAVLWLNVNVDNSATVAQFTPDLRLYYFDDSAQDVYKWVNNRHSDVHYSDAPMPLAYVDLSEYAQIEVVGVLESAVGEERLSLPDFGFDLYSLSVTVAGASTNAFNISDFNETLDVPVPLRVLNVNENITALKNNWNWMGSGYQKSQVFYPFEYERAVLEVVIKGQPTFEDSIFLIEGKVHLFEQGGQGSVASWANNAFSDGIMIDAATPYDSITLSPNDIRITSVATHTPSSIVDGVDLYPVSFEVDNIYVSRVKVPAFTDNTEVAVLPLANDMVIVSIFSGKTQCNNDGISNSQAQALLTDTDIAVSSAFCGESTGLNYTTVCGGLTGQLHAFAIAKSDLAAAQTAGFTNIENLVDTGTGTGYNLSACAN